MEGKSRKEGASRTDGRTERNVNDAAVFPIPIPIPSR